MSKVLSFLGWFFGISLVIIALGSLSRGEILPFSFFLTSGIATLPNIVTKIQKLYLEKSSKNLPKFSIVVISLVLFSIGVWTTPSKIQQKGIISNNENQKIAETQKSSQKSEISSSLISSSKNQQSEKSTNIPKYEIIYELLKKRYDDGKYYYVLMNNVNTSNDKFKNDIKIIIKKITQEKGTKISIEFYDKKEILELSYKQYGTLSLKKPLTQEETFEKSVHHIADYSGELENGIYFNTLTFFPSTFTDNPKVGKWLETIEFNITK